MSPAPASLRLRARLTYVGLYAAVGSATPYLPLYYRHVGLDLGAIGLVVATGSIASLLAGPSWGLLSDRRAGSPWVFLAAGLTALAGGATLWLAGRAGDVLPVVLLGVALFAGGMGGMSPMLDARALELAGPERSGFGPQRAWGSLSFVIVAFGAGEAVDRFGIEACLVLLAIALVSTALLGFSLGPSRLGQSPLGPSRLGPSRLDAHRASSASTLALQPESTLRALATPALGLFLGGAYLTFSTLAGINAFMSLRYAELGAPAAVIGSSWAVGAAVEIPVMLRFPWLASRVGAGRLAVVGVVIFTLRALGAALTNDAGVLVALTAFGGIGFACFVVGGATYVSGHAPPRLAATAQSLFSGFANNLGQVTAGVVGGRLADSIGITGLFGASAALGVVAAMVVALAVRVGGDGAARGTTSGPELGSGTGSAAPDQGSVTGLGGPEQAAQSIARATSEMSRSIVSSS